MDDSFTWKAGQRLSDPAIQVKAPLHRLNTDGGIIPKPSQSSGQAAIAAVLKNPKGLLMDVISRRMGWVQDHHVAEYRALIEGLRLARGHRITRLHVQSDSRLIVQQLGETSRTKKDHLRPLRAEALAVIGEFSYLTLSHVPRKQNAEADALANRALCR